MPCWGVRARAMAQILTWMAQGGPVMWLIALDGLGMAVLIAERCLSLNPAGRPPPPPVLLGDLARVPSRVVADALAADPVLERGFATLRLLIVIAPLLGLLGTVSGMIGTFQALVERGGMAATGIAQALITTQFGLALAAAGLIAEALLLARRRHLVVAWQAQACARAVAPDREGGI